jgi:hypothetical protein
MPDRQVSPDFQIFLSRRASQGEHIPGTSLYRTPPKLIKASLTVLTPEFFISSCVKTVTKAGNFNGSSGYLFAVTM